MSYAQPAGAPPKLQGEDEAQEIIRANTSPRYKRLAALESWVEGTQYDGLVSWWDDSVPLWERAPCVVYPVVDVAIQSNVDLILGEGRFPTFSTKSTDDEKSADEVESEADELDRFIARHHELSRFRSHCRDALRSAQGCGTAVGLHGARDGKPFAELIPARSCEPKLGVHGEAISLEIRYPYVEEYKDADGTWKVRVKLFRRLIDDTNDITFQPADAEKQGREPNWAPDASRSVEHGFGFCPAVWYPFMRGCHTVSQIDGKAIHRKLTDEIRAHDTARSQWHRGALFSEPQITECGVAPGYNPTGKGRTPIVPSTEKGGLPGPDNPATGAYASAAPTGARKKGPGYVWQYENHETKVAVLEYGAGALKSQEENARDLLHKLQEALGVVLLDPNSIKFAATTSGKALEAIKQRQIDRCNQYRDDFRDGYLIPSIEMQLRITQKLGGALTVAGAAEVAERLLAEVSPDAA